MRHFRSITALVLVFLFLAAAPLAAAESLRFTDPDGQPLTGWQKKDGVWYFADQNGFPRTGWLKRAGRWYYLDPDSGAMKTGWVRDGKYWYRLNASGVMQTGWITDEGKRYFLDASGRMKTGWIFDEGQWYYLNAYGVMKTGWIKSGGEWYYADSAGCMVTGWRRIGRRWYYFIESEEGLGTMLSDSALVEGGHLYFLGASGAMLTKTVSWEGQTLPLTSSGALDESRVSFSLIREIKNAAFWADPMEESDTRTIDPSKPMVALTFDDGPGPGTTDILDTLEATGSVATFFVVGDRLASRQSYLVRESELGCEIAIHTWSHANLTKLSESEIESELVKTRDAIREYTGITPALVRTPGGSANDTIKGVCRELGYPIIHWSVDTLDWKTRDADATYDAIMNNVKDGSIILCHDLWAPTGEAMKRVIPELIEQGYQLVTVSELLAYRKGNVSPGTVYYSAYPQ